MDKTDIQKIIEGLKPTLTDKIGELHKILEIQNENSNKFENKVNLHIEKVDKWQLRAEPLVTAYENTGWLWNNFLKFLKFIVLVGAAIGAYFIIKDKLY